jgi:subtilase family serine protease
VIVAFKGRFGRVIGTSPATAQWAGIAALSNEMAGHRQGPLNTRLYHVGKSSSYSEAFHDITSGGNTFAGFAGYSAVPGWDPVTGLGSPNVAVLLPLLS